MQRDPELLSSKRFDVAVIGGGINGAAVAREAALRGLKVVLVEARDFASGTSSRSSKLIHGGLRYLQQGDWRLVQEARRERRLLLKLAPHLVHRLPFLLPIYQDDPFSPLRVRLGLAIYDLFGTVGRGDRHCMLSRKAVLALMPSLRATGLRAGAAFFDAQTDDARLTLEYILDAADHGAVVANYAEICGFTLAGSRVASAETRDLVTGRRYEISARVWVNATGPWVDRLRALLPQFDGTKTVRLTKGTHLIVPRICGTHALLTAIPPGQRILLTIPWQECTLVGTTDTDYDGDPAAVQPSLDDVDYLLNAVNRVLDKPITPSDVLGSFAGVRALVIQPGRSASATTRESRFHRDPWATNFVSVCGGKLTTARALGEKFCDELEPQLQSGCAGARPTRAALLPGGREGDVDPDGADAVKEAAARFAVPREAAERMIRVYGSRWRQVRELLREDPNWARPLPGRASLLAVEVVFAIRHEMAVKPEDFLLRRSGLSWRGGAVLRDAGPEVARIFSAQGRTHFNLGAP